MATKKKKEYDPLDEFRDAVGIAERYFQRGANALTDAEKRVLKDAQRNEKFAEWFNSRKADSKGSKSAPTQKTRSGGVIATTPGEGGRVATLPGLNKYLDNQSYVRNNNVVSPGGFQKSGLDADSQVRRSGLVTDQSDGVNTAAINYDGSSQVIGGRKLSKRETDYIISRGIRGATMGPEQQAIYDRWVMLRRNAQKAREDARVKEEERRERERVAEENQKRISMKAQNLGLAPDANEFEIARAEELRKKQDELEYKLMENSMMERAKRRQRAMDLGFNSADYGDGISDEEYKRILRNRSYGLPDRYDLSDADEEMLKKGKKRVGYSARDQRDIDELDDALSSRMTDPSYTEDEVAQLADIVNSRKARYQKGVVDVPVDEMSVADVLANGEASEKHGGTFVRDYDNKLKFFPYKTSDEEKGKNALEKEERGSILRSMESQRKSYDNLGEFDERRKTPFDLNAAFENARKSWDLVVGSQNKGVQTTTCPKCGAEMPLGGKCAKCGYVAGGDVQPQAGTTDVVSPPVQAQQHVKQSYL